MYQGATPTTSQAAIMIINTGGRDVAIDKVTVRGKKPIGLVFCATTDGSISDDLPFVASLSASSTVHVGIFNDIELDATTNDMTAIRLHHGRLPQES